MPRSFSRVAASLLICGLCDQALAVSSGAGSDCSSWVEGCEPLGSGSEKAHGSPTFNNYDPMNPAPWMIPPSPGTPYPYNAVVLHPPPAPTSPFATRDMGDVHLQTPVALPRPTLTDLIPPMFGSSMNGQKGSSLSYDTGIAAQATGPLPQITGPAAQQWTQEMSAMGAGNGGGAYQYDQNLSPRSNR